MTAERRPNAPPSDPRPGAPKPFGPRPDDPDRSELRPNETPGRRGRSDRAPEDGAAFKAELKAAARAIGLDAVGVTTAAPFHELRPILEEYYGRGYDSGFEKGTIDERVDPRRTMPWAQSIIAAAMAYPSKLKNAPKSVPGARRGFIARSAWGRDYHGVLRERLEALLAWIRERVPSVRGEILVDTGVLSDRAVAARAGIGWIGKNGLLITPDYGSFVYLGELVLDLPLPPDAPMEDRCGSCTKCLDACPTSAFIRPGALDSKKCLSYHTQTKGMVPLPYREKLGNRLYGCDACQVVCPYNRGVDADHHPEFRPDPEVVKPLLMPLIGLSKKAFAETFAKTAAGWRGKRTLERNAIIALAHHRAPEAVSVLAERLALDPRPVIRGTAAWALGKIGGEAAKAALEAARARERDPMVREEIEAALARLSGASGRSGAEEEGRPANDRSGIG
ncbi:MAG: tRNA epoxyqueuosine(34) reductase QueG [Hydrogenibacillus schlegelii]|nr:tRNA epoxyqueuosine(34) reductase QueG [Hydrogenibacillus schlegelii]